MESNINCPDVTIPNGTAVSNTLKAREVYASAYVLLLLAPAALDAHTYTIEVTDDPDVAAPVFRTLQDGGADVAPPGAGKASEVIGLIASQGFRIKDTTGNVAADRTWKVRMKENISN